MRVLAVLVLVAAAAGPVAALPAAADPTPVHVPLAPGTGAAFVHFWRSCGWCPPDPHPQFAAYFLTEGREGRLLSALLVVFILFVFLPPDQVQNHELIGSVPHQGIKYVRIHVRHTFVLFSFSFFFLFFFFLSLFLFLFR